MDDQSFIEEVSFGDDELVPAIAQDFHSGEVLMMAWMNRESLALSVREGRAIYWSRSRECLWRKGEESGNTQTLKELCLDCDGDTILLKVDQQGGIACHTGRKHCFYRRLESNNWVVTEDIQREPADMYSSARNGRPDNE